MLYQLSYAPEATRKHSRRVVKLLEMRRLELLTPCLQSRCSTN